MITPCIALMCGALLLMGNEALGQAAAEPLRLEGRVDLLAGTDITGAAAHVGLGVARRFGIFQLGVLAGAGPSEDGTSGRAEVIGRFHVDPYRQRRWGLYGAAGAGTLWRSTPEPYLTFSAGLEGPRSAGGWSPALEVGFGRGLRVAAAIRRTPPRRR